MRCRVRRAFARLGPGLNKIFLDFGAEWRNAGCSMLPGHEPGSADPGRARSAAPRTVTSWAVRDELDTTSLWCLRWSQPRPPFSRHAHQLIWTERTHGMEGFSLTQIGVPLRRGAVDANQIIPAVYLKRISRTRLRGRCSRRCVRIRFRPQPGGLQAWLVAVAGPDFRA